MCVLWLSPHQMHVHLVQAVGACLPVGQCSSQLGSGPVSWAVGQSVCQWASQLVSGPVSTMCCQSVGLLGAVDCVRGVHMVIQWYLCVQCCGSDSPVGWVSGVDPISAVGGCHVMSVGEAVQLV